MMTFKQLEAFAYVVQEGGFAQAAQKLHTTQSAISKRIQELESIFNTPLFDRSLRSARLTEKGEEMFMVAKQLLNDRDLVVERFQSKDVIERHLRIGITELTAMTWLPRLINMIQSEYPRVIIEPHVDAGMPLRDKLLADQVDLIIAPELFEDQRLTSIRVGEIENEWMCKPGMVKKNAKLQISDLSNYRLLTQDQRSGVGQLYNRWLNSHGIYPKNTVFSNSLVTLIGLTISGMGISYLPKKCLSQMTANGILQPITISTPLPPAKYATIYRKDRESEFLTTIVGLAQKSCDFGTIFQVG